MTAREKALNRLQMYQFAMHDAKLFLDTHPNDRDALKAFRQYNKLVEDAMEDFVKRYGPVLASQVSEDAESFDWVKGPWPWEVES